MAITDLPPLSRRERQIMDVLYRLGSGTTADVLAGLGDQPNYSTVRAQLRVLEEKGHVWHEENKLTYVFFPSQAREKVRGSALRHLVKTFFDGSTEQMMTALLGGEVTRLSADELDRLSLLVEEAKKRSQEAPQPSRKASVSKASGGKR